MKKLVILASVALLAGCAAPLPEAGPAVTAAVASGSVPPDAARLIVCGGHTTGLIFTLPYAEGRIYIDGQQVAALSGSNGSAKECQPVLLSPGVHEVKIGGTDSSARRMTFAPGQQVVLRLDDDRRRREVAGLFIGVLSLAVDQQFTVTAIPAPLPHHKILAPVRG